MPSLNDLLLTLELGSLKGLLAGLLLPPVPFIAMVLIGAMMLRSRPQRGWTLVLTGCVALWLSSTSLVGAALIRVLTRPPPALTSSAIADLKQVAAASKTVIVVLGGGLEVYAAEFGMSNLAPFSMERLRYGVWLAKATGLPLAFSGGLGYGLPDGPSEAEIATRIAATEFNRPLRWAESRSRDTSENGQFTVALLRPAGIERIVLVTHNFHMRRAMGDFERAAQRAGIKLSILPAPMGLGRASDGWLPSTTGFAQTRLALHEWLGRLAGA